MNSSRPSSHDDVTDLVQQHNLKNLSDTALLESHSARAISDRLNQEPSHSYLKDFTLGAIDGAVTTFAVVSGVAGAGLDDRIILVLGFANLVGDGFSMAAGNYLGTNAEKEERIRLRQIEIEHIERIPEGERKEVEQILRRQGLKEESLKMAVKEITADQDRWVEIMLREEHGLSFAAPDAWKAAGSTFLAFILIGLLPLLPFLLNVFAHDAFSNPYLASVLVTGIAFFVVGAIKALVVEQSWIRSGLETVAVGGSAAGLAYSCGYLIQSLI